MSFRIFLPAFICVILAIGISKYCDFSLNQKTWIELKASFLKLFSSSVVPKEGLFTPQELRKYTGENNGPIYLAILGSVFDVSGERGKEFYKVGGSYGFFAGRDASKAFVTGDFTEEGLTDDISGLSPNELSDLKDWLSKYHSDYIYKGKLIGRFYDSTGKPTDLLRSIDERVSSLKKRESSYKKKFPPCNVEYTAEKGTRIWCSKLSGGVSRDWVGVPRKFYEPGTEGPIKYRCACVNPKDLDGGQFKQYDNCDPSSSSCSLPP